MVGPTVADILANRQTGTKHEFSPVKIYAYRPLLEP